MGLMRLIYASRATGDATLSEITDMLDRARVNNQKAGVSGLLIFDSRFFLQLLEGDRANVNAIYSRIVADPRHEEVTLLSYGSIAQRTYGAWAMGYVSHVDADTLRAQTGRDTFDPFLMAAEDAPPLMAALAKTS